MSDNGNDGGPRDGAPVGDALLRELRAALDRARAARHERRRVDAAAGPNGEMRRASDALQAPAISQAATGEAAGEAAPPGAPAADIPATTADDLAMLREALGFVEALGPYAPPPRPADMPDEGRVFATTASGFRVLVIERKIRRGVDSSRVVRGGPDASPKWVPTASLARFAGCEITE